MLNVAWDEKLLSRATVQLVQERTIELPDHHLEESLHQAYAYCTNLTSIHSKSFYMASGLLPAEKRKAIRALYAFCRTTDDIIDIQHHAGGSELNYWRDQSLSSKPRANDPVSMAWADTRQKFQIPVHFAHQLIDGVASDTYKRSYQTFEELTDYCYSVASTVGLMSMHIIGFSTDEAIRYAIKLGVALQLTNILRDIAEDYKIGRIYLPQDELHEFGITRNHFQEGIIDSRWRSIMKFQIERTRKIYEEAWPGIRILNQSGRLSIAAAATFYRGILDEIENNDYDIFSQRASVDKWRKLSMVPGLWMNYSLFNK